MKQQVLFKLDESDITHPFGQETVFEPQRGIIQVKLEAGYSQVNILDADINQLLKSLDTEQSSFQYLKLLSNGISFIVDENEAEKWLTYRITKGLSIMKVHAANLREENGLIAHILEIATQMDIEINHISDLYNCLTLVLNEKDAKELCREILNKKI